MLYYFVRPHSSLFRDSTLLARPSENKVFNPSESVINGGVWAMAFTMVVAGAAIMIQIIGKPV